MKQPGRFSTADRAYFNYKTEKVILTGNAVVHDRDEVELKSSRVVMYMDVKRGIVSGGQRTPLQITIPIQE